MPTPTPTPTSPPVGRALFNAARFDRSRFDESRLVTLASVLSYTLTGPTVGVVGTPLTYTVTPSDYFSGTITISKTGSGTLSTTNIVFNCEDEGETFVFIPTAAGLASVSANSGGILTDPPTINITIAATAAASYTLSTSTTGHLGVPQAVSAALDNAGIATITLNSTGGNFSDQTISFSNETGPKSINFIPTVLGVVTITATNNVGLTNHAPLSITVTSLATTYTVITNSFGTYLVPQLVTIQLDSTDTVTITLHSVSGTFDNSTINFTLESGPKYALFTPNVLGTALITATNNASLIDPVTNIIVSLPDPIPATTYVLMTNGTGAVGVAQTVTLITDFPWTGTITLYSTRGKLSSTTVVFNSESGPKTILFTPNSAGTAIISSTNDGDLVDPDPVSVSAPALAITYTIATNSPATVGYIQPIIVTINHKWTGIITLSAVGGVITPNTIAFLFDTGPESVSFAPMTPGIGVITSANNSNLVNPEPLSIIIKDNIILASTYIILTATTGTIGIGQSVSITIDHLWIGSITLSSVGGFFSDTIINFNNEKGPKLLAFTPTTTGDVIISTSNNGVLSNPDSIHVMVAAAAAAYTLSTPVTGLVGSSQPVTITIDNVWTGIVTLDATLGNLSSNAVIFNNEQGPKTIGFTPTGAGIALITSSNYFSITNPAPVSSLISMPASTYILGATSMGVIGISQPITITINKPWTGIITLAATTVLGIPTGTLSTTSVSFSSEMGPKTVNFTPTDIGEIFIYSSNNEALDDPSPLMLTIIRAPLPATSYRLISSNPGYVGVLQTVSVLLNHSDTTNITLHISGSIMSSYTLSFHIEVGPKIIQFISETVETVTISSDNDIGLSDPAPLLIDIIAKVTRRAAQLLNIKNISNQVINILIGQLVEPDGDNISVSISGFPANEAGSIEVQPGQHVMVEESRVSNVQIQSYLDRKMVIVIDATPN